ncbi:MAG: ImmA/IrrE family metallo-endopeptidase [Acidobacteriota bacterium]
MSHPPKVDPATVYADAFVDRFGVDGARDLALIAPKIGLKITEVDADAFEGALRRIKGRMIGTIALSRSITDPGRRRFTAAHELGHYLIPSHAEASSPCRPIDIERWDPSLHAREIEANRFAAAALMSRASIADLFKGEPSFDAVERIVDRRGTSFTSSAYRYVQLSGERIAVVWSEGGQAKWARGSDELYRIVRLGPLAAETLASRAFRNAPVPDAFDRVDATAWLYDRNLREGATILEHSKVLGRYGVLTLLWIDEPIERWREYGDED